jgi:hypothetical protein
MELKVLESPGKEWDDFASRYTDLIFYQSVWSEVLRKGLGGQPLYFCLKQGDEIVAGLPGILLNYRIFKVLYASIPYGNFLGERSFFLPFMELLDNAFRRRGIHQVRIAESPFLEPYQPNSFRSVLAKCSLLDLTGFERERIWDSYRGEVRRAIRKAKKGGLSVKCLTSRQEIEVFYRLYLASMERNRAMAKYPIRWFHALFEVLAHQKKVDIFFAVNHQDEYVAGVVLVYSATSNHYLHNGSFERYLENRPNDLIVDRIIEQGVKEGKKVLDFMGSDLNDLSLLRFKEKWGSKSVDIHTYVRDYRPSRCRIWEFGKRVMSSTLGTWLLRKIRG